MPRRLREEGRIALDRFIAREFAGTQVIAEVDEGEAGQLIVDHAHDEHADLIMMPTRGYGPFRAMLLGSITAKVLHDARCPVWTGVHTDQMQAHPPERWKRHAVRSGHRSSGTWPCCAGRPSSAPSKAWSCGWSTRWRARIPRWTRESDPSMYDFLFNVARERMVKMQAEAGTKFEVCLLGGRAERAVHQAAIGHDADLIVIGRGVMQKKMGRLRSERLLHHSRSALPGDQHLKWT